MQRHITALRTCTAVRAGTGQGVVRRCFVPAARALQRCSVAWPPRLTHPCTAAQLQGRSNARKGYQSSSAATAGWAQQAEEATQLHSLTSAGGRRLLVALQEYDRWLFLRIQDACHTKASTPAGACPAVGKKLKYAMALQFGLRHGELQLASHAGSSSTAARRRCHERHAITAQVCSSVSEQLQPRFSMRRSRFPVERCQRPT